MKNIGEVYKNINGSKTPVGFPANIIILDDGRDVEEAFANIEIPESSNLGDWRIENGALISKDDNIILNGETGTITSISGSEKIVLKNGRISFYTIEEDTETLQGRIYTHNNTGGLMLESQDSRPVLFSNGGYIRGLLQDEKDPDNLSDENRLVLFPLRDSDNKIKDDAGTFISGEAIVTGHVVERNPNQLKEIVFYENGFRIVVGQGENEGFEKEIDFIVTEDMNGDIIEIFNKGSGQKIDISYIGGEL